MGEERATLRSGEKSLPLHSSPRLCPVADCFVEMEFDLPTDLFREIERAKPENLGVKAFLALLLEMGLAAENRRRRKTP